MTISYDVDSSFFKLIFCKWHGSILKLTWKVLLVYLGAYYAIYFTQKFALDAEQKGAALRILLTCKLTCKSSAGVHP